MTPSELHHRLVGKYLFTHWLYTEGGCCILG